MSLHCLSCHCLCCHLVVTSYIGSRRLTARPHISLIPDVFVALQSSPEDETTQPMKGGQGKEQGGKGDKSAGQAADTENVTDV